MQVIALIQSQPADGLCVDFGQFAPEVVLYVGCCGMSSDWRHGGERLLGNQEGLGLDRIVVSARCHGSLEFVYGVHD